MIVCLSPNGPMVHASDDTPTRLFVATKAGVAVLDADASMREWRHVTTTLENAHVSALLFDQTSGRLFAGTHGDGVFASTDLGSTWTASSDGLTLMNVFSLGQAVTNGRSVLLAGTEPVMLYSSADEARTWQAHTALEHIPGDDKWSFPAPPHVAHLKAIAVDAADSKTWYACIEQGALLRTHDAGQTWHEISSYARPDDRWYRDIHKVVPSATNPDRLLMTTGIGIYRSDDRGVSWRRLTTEDFAIAYPDHLIVSPCDEAMLFVSGASTTPNVWRETHRATAMVQRSRDGGESWHLASDGLPMSGRSAIEAMSVAAHGDDFALFVGNTDGEVYASYDAADSWHRIAANLAPISKAMHADHLT